MKGIVYLVQPSELVGTDRYKIGCSGMPTLRRCQIGYRNGTRYICIMEVYEPLQAENRIKTVFREQFTLIAGAEFFQGDEAAMLQIFFNIAKEYIRPVIPAAPVAPAVAPAAPRAYEGPETSYSRFVDHILSDKPEWYRSGEWLPKTILVEKYNEMNGTDISLRTLMRNLREDNLIKRISNGQKRMRMGFGRNQVRVFLAK